MAKKNIPLDDLLGRTVAQDGHEWTVAYRPELQRIALTRPIDIPTLLGLLRRGELRPDTTPDQVGREPLPSSRDETQVEIAHVEAILHGAFAAQLEAKLVLAYRVHLAALQKHLEQRSEGLVG